MKSLTREPPPRPPAWPPWPFGPPLRGRLATPGGGVVVPPASSRAAGPRGRAQRRPHAHRTAPRTPTNN